MRIKQAANMARVMQWYVLARFRTSVLRRSQRTNLPNTKGSAVFSLQNKGGLLQGVSLPVDCRAASTQTVDNWLQWCPNAVELRQQLFGKPPSVKTVGAMSQQPQHRKMTELIEAER